MNPFPTLFSSCRRYRYTLWRQWDMQHDLVASQGGSAYDRTDQFLMVIALNPSTADETHDDPTVRRCIDYAQRWGFGGLCMTNLFGWRDTLPSRMKAAAEPVGVGNDVAIESVAAEAGLVLAAWGRHGTWLDRDKRVRELVGSMQCLGTNKDGTPKHPLYLSKELLPVRFDGSATDT